MFNIHVCRLLVGVVPAWDMSCQLRGHSKDRKFIIIIIIILGNSQNI